MKGPVIFGPNWPIGHFMGIYWNKYNTFPVHSLQFAPTYALEITLMLHYLLYYCIHSMSNKWSHLMIRIIIFFMFKTEEPVHT